MKCQNLVKDKMDMRTSKSGYEFSHPNEMKPKMHMQSDGMQGTQHVQTETTHQTQQVNQSMIKE